MFNAETVAKEIFNVLRSFDYEVDLYNADGDKVNEPTEARRFFAFPNNTTVSIHEDGENSSVKLLLSKTVKIASVEGLIDTMRTLCTRFGVLFNVRQYDKELKPRDLSPHLDEGVESVTDIINEGPRAPDPDKGEKVALRALLSGDPPEPIQVNAAAWEAFVADPPSLEVARTPDIISKAQMGASANQDDLRRIRLLSLAPLIVDNTMHNLIAFVAAKFEEGDNSALLRKIADQAVKATYPADIIAEGFEGDMLSEEELNEYGFTSRGNGGAPRGHRQYSVGSGSARQGGMSATARGAAKPKGHGAFSNPTNRDNFEADPTLRANQVQEDVEDTDLEAGEVVDAAEAGDEDAISTYERVTGDTQAFDDADKDSDDDEEGKSLAPMKNITAESWNDDGLLIKEGYGEFGEWFNSLSSEALFESEDLEVVEEECTDEECEDDCYMGKVVEGTHQSHAHDKASSLGYKRVHSFDAAGNKTDHYEHPEGRKMTIKHGSAGGATIDGDPMDARKVRAYADQEAGVKESLTDDPHPIDFHKSRGEEGSEVAIDLALTQLGDEFDVNEFLDERGMDFGYNKEDLAHLDSTDLELDYSGIRDALHHYLEQALDSLYGDELPASVSEPVVDQVIDQVTSEVEANGFSVVGREVEADDIDSGLDDGIGGDELLLDGDEDVLSNEDVLQPVNKGADFTREVTVDKDEEYVNRLTKLAGITPQR